MDRFEVGMLARSKAGHDKGCLYVISRIEGEYVYLTDGRLKPVEHPKKKKIKHIQVYKRIPKDLLVLSVGQFKNEDIRHVMKQEKF